MPSTQESIIVCWTYCYQFGRNCSLINLSSLGYSGWIFFRGFFFFNNYLFIKKIVAETFQVTHSVEIFPSRSGSWASLLVCKQPFFLFFTPVLGVCIYIYQMAFKFIESDSYTYNFGIGHFEETCLPIFWLDQFQMLACYSTSRKARKCFLMDLWFYLN